MKTVRLLNECQFIYGSAMHRADSGRDACSIRQVDGETVLVFRGTLCEGDAGLRDWINDLNAKLSWRPEYPGLVHAGFAGALENLWPWLAQYNFQDARLWITGHSKGAALAVLCGWRLRDLKPRVVTFAGPKPGNLNFARAYTVDCLRYVNPYDLVPTLPLATDYVHAGLEIRPGSAWTAPRDLLDNHHLETGYAPWISDTELPQAA